MPAKESIAHGTIDIYRFKYATKGQCFFRMSFPITLSFLAEFPNKESLSVGILLVTVLHLHALFF